MSAPSIFPGQPGDPFSDPVMDTSMLMLHDALKALSPPALFADDPDEAGTVFDGLRAVEVIRFGFDSRSDIARGLSLLARAIERKAAEVAS